MRYKKRWRIGLIVLIVGLLAFGTAIVGFSASVDPIIDPPGMRAGGNEPPIDDCVEYKVDSDDLVGVTDGETVRYYFKDLTITGDINVKDTDYVDITFYVSEDDIMSFDWQSTVAIGHVFVKGGPGGYLFSYDPPVYQDTNLFCATGISHITFYICEPETAELDITATLDLVWTRDIEWDIEKSVIPAKWDLFKGDSGQSKYTVEVTKTKDDEVSTLAWEVCVENLGPAEAESVLLTVDLYKDGEVLQNLLTNEPLGDIAVGPASKVCEGDTIDPFSFEEDAVYQIKATATLDNGDPASVQSSEETANLDLTGEPEVTVTDSWKGELVSGLTASQTFTYYRDFDCESYLDESAKEEQADGYWRFFNTAEIVETEQSDDAYVDVKCYALQVTKTAETSFKRTHDWEIDKSVRTDNEEDLDGFPKIWLYPDESGDESAYWEVCVTYLGYEDSDLKVAGTITIYNQHPTKQAEINSVTDLICDSISATIYTDSELTDELDIDEDDPLIIPANSPVTLYYEADLDEIPDQDCTNTATAVQQNFDYSWDLAATANGTTSYSGSADVIVSDEPTSEVNKEVDVVDEMLDWAHPLSTNGDVVTLGTLNADDYEVGDDPECFSYSEDFAWADYDDPDPASWEIDNTAEVIGDDDEVLDSADAKLKINWLDEELEVSKTVDTSYIRTHDWEIDKSVETENEEFVNGTPKIWLYVDGSGDETATWEVCVTYLGYEDSDFVVFGEITIENTGDLNAEITNIVDTLAGDSIAIYYNDEYTDAYDPDADPIDLPKGETLTLYYREFVNEKIEGENEVTVTTSLERDYSSGDVAIPDWGDPDDEIHASVEVTDTNAGFADKYGEVNLDADDYEVGDEVCFDYSENFAFVEYDECGSFQYDNTAEIIGDDDEVLDSADATLKVNVQCYIYETAYAKSDDAICFIPTFSNWGWTNPIEEPGEYEWDLWAGAGQCDTSKGTLVGSVTVVYDDDGYVTVTFNVDAPYILEETHVYAGDDMFPQMRRGRRGWVDTVAPGQYYNNSPFDDDELVYVIAHAVVGMPDPDFGPDPTE